MLNADLARTSNTFLRPVGQARAGGYRRSGAAGRHIRRGCEPGAWGRAAITAVAMLTIRATSDDQTGPTGASSAKIVPRAGQVANQCARRLSNRSTPDAWMNRLRRASEADCADQLTNPEGNQHRECSTDNDPRDRSPWRTPADAGTHRARPRKSEQHDNECHRDANAGR